MTIKSRLERTEIKNKIISGQKKNPEKELK